jgi:Holliday junction resolvase RusA-like endonuclease
MKVEFDIKLGKIAPMGKPSVRSSFKRAYFPKKYKDYCLLVGMIISRQDTNKIKFGKTPTHVCVEFHFTRKKVTKPDIDNLLKSIFDVVTDLGIWDDDQYICEVSAKKLYCSENRIKLCIMKN